MTTHSATPKPRYRRSSPNYPAQARTDRLNRFIAVAAGAGMLASLGVAFVSAAGLLH